MNYELFRHLNKNIYLVNMTREQGYFSELVQRGLEKHIPTQKNITLIINKKWFASGSICTACGHIPQCHHCSVSIAYHHTDNSSHQRTNSLTHQLTGICHICKTLYPVPSTCEQCHQPNTIKLYWLTIQKTADFIKEQYHIEPLIIQSETVSSQAKIRKLLPVLTEHRVHIGTHVLSNDQSDILIILAADQSLTLPDYSVRQDTFVQLYRLIQTSTASTIIIQAYDTHHDSIRSACALDRDWFFEKEKIFRQSHYYPPYGELCVIKYKNENETTLHHAIGQLTKELLYLQQNYEYPQLTIYATPPLVYKKFGKFYYHIIVLGPEDQVRPFMDIAFSKLMMRKRWFKIDRMAHGIV